MTDKANGNKHLQINQSTVEQVQSIFYEIMCPWLRHGLIQLLNYSGPRKFVTYFKLYCVLFTHSFYTLCL